MKIYCKSFYDDDEPEDNEDFDYDYDPHSEEWYIARNKGEDTDPFI